MSKKSTPSQDRSITITPSSKWSVVSLTILENYKLKVKFLDDTTGIIDMKIYIESPKAGVFKELKDINLFKQAYIELGAVTWPNGLDIAPDRMHKELQDKDIWIM